MNRLTEEELLAVDALQKNDDDNVTAYSRSYKKRMRGGNPIEGTEVICIYVKKKLSSSALGSSILPEKILDHEVDVVEIGELKATYSGSVAVPDIRRGRTAFLIGGESIGHNNITAGTIGRMVMKGDVPMMLSNNHVLANASLLNEPKAIVGDLIYQPGPLDRDAIDNPESDAFYKAGVLHTWIPLDPDGDNLVDCALAIPTKRSWYFYTQLGMNINGLSNIMDPLDLRDGLIVQKSGRTTGITSLQIIDTDAVLNVSIDGSDIRFIDQILMKGTPSGAGSAGGDSGSIIVFKGDQDEWRNVGLLFAASDTVTAANRIGNVLDALGVVLEGDFAGDPVVVENTHVYGPSSDSEMIKVVAKVSRKSALDVVVPSQVAENAAVEILGTLRDEETGIGLANRSIALAVNGEVFRVTTDENGNFLYIHAAGFGAPNDVEIVGTFDGDK